MRRVLCALSLVLLLAGCVTVVDLPIPQHDPIVQLVQIPTGGRDAAVHGPLAVTYELTIFNPFEHTLFVRAVDLHSSGVGTYHVAAQTRRLNVAVPPHESVSTRLRISAWANGGQASAYEPMTIHGLLHYGRGRTLAFETNP